MMNILIIDDHELFSEGLKLLLLAINKDHTVLCADSCAEAKALNDKESIELILLDYFLQYSTGIESLSTIKDAFPKSNIVIISSEDSTEIILSCIANGATGFIPKSSSKETLIKALKLVSSGGIYIPPHILESCNKKPQQQKVELTQRQHDVICLAIKGLANKVIAHQLTISEGTVKAHLSAIFAKIGVNNRTEAAIYASKFSFQIKSNQK